MNIKHRTKFIDLLRDAVLERYGRGRPETVAEVKMEIRREQAYTGFAAGTFVLEN
jgi:hypothetical protein